MVFGRFIADVRLRQRTVYGVTSSRVIIIAGLFTESIQSLQLRGLVDTSLVERSDGSGTILLGSSSHSKGPVPGWPGTGQGAPPSLEGIPQARVVYELIRRVQAAAA